jgi:integrase
MERSGVTADDDRGEPWSQLDVGGLRAFGNWLAVDGIAQARALRTLARPRVPRKVMEPLSDTDLRRLLGAADLRERAILLLLLDTGLRVSEVVGISLVPAHVRPQLPRQWRRRVHAAADLTAMKHRPRLIKPGVFDQEGALLARRAYGRNLAPLAERQMST